MGMQEVKKVRRADTRAVPIAVTGRRTCRFESVTSVANRMPWRPGLRDCVELSLHS